MIAYLDTCTILNLLQINYDDEYIKYLTKSFEEIKLTPIVFEELGTNKFVNVIDDSHKEILDNIIYNQIQCYVDASDCSDALVFTQKRNAHCFKKNGESHTVSHSLMHSRFGDDFGHNLLKTHFITDDMPAKEDFNGYYRTNIIGQFLDSIDLMTFFWLRKIITKNDVIKYCQSLKQLYSKDIGLLLIKLRDYSRDFAEALSGKQKIILTKLIGILSNIKDDTNNEISEIISDPDFKDILKKNKEWKELLANIQQSNFREKIPYINKRIEDLEKVWEIT